MAAGVPVDVLVNLGSPMPQQLTSQSSATPACLLLDSQLLDAAEDDTFGLYSKATSCTGAAEITTPLGLPSASSETNLGLLVNVEECSEVKERDMKRKPPGSTSSAGSSSSSRLMDPIIDSPFALAWDLIEEGARTLAEDIRANKVDMNTGPESPLISPTSLRKQQPASFLIDSSPEQQTEPAVPKPASLPKDLAKKKTVITPSLKLRATTVAASPGPSRAASNTALKNRSTPQTPSRIAPVVKRKSLALPASPLTSQRVSAGTSAASQAKSNSQLPSFKAPLKPKLSAPATASTLSKPTKTGPVKATYNQAPHPGTPRPPLKATPIQSADNGTPASVSNAARPVLVRAASTLSKSEGKSFQRQGSLRLPSKRASFGPNISKASLNSSACSDASSTASDVGPSTKFTSKLANPRTSLMYRNKENKPN